MGKFSHIFIKETIKPKQPVAQEIVESTEKVLTLEQFLAEQSEEYHAFRSNHTGTTYHISTTNKDKINKLGTHQSAEVEVAHHNGEKLNIDKVYAHRIGNSIHMHDKEGNHIDSFPHKKG